MRYVLKLEGSLTEGRAMVRDESGRDVYAMRTMGFGYSFEDTAGKQLALIKLKFQFISFGRTYQIFREDSLAATMRLSLLTLIKSSLKIGLPEGQGFQLEGNIMGYEYTFLREGRPVAEVSGRPTGGSWGVNIVEGEDDVLILACVATIAATYYPSKWGEPPGRNSYTCPRSP